MTIIRPNLTPKERVNKLLTMCTYATLIGILLLIGALGEVRTLYVAYTAGLASHPEHALWVDWAAFILGFSGFILLAYAVIGWLCEAESIHRAAQSEQPPS